MSGGIETELARLALAARRRREATIRALIGIVIVLGALAAFSIVTRSVDVPREWRKAWPNTDFSRHVVPYSEIVSGGPARDGIPPIDAPAFAPVDRLPDPPPDNMPLMGIEIGGDARAYPLGILIWHEIVNDTVGGVPVTITYCPLCNSGVAFERRVRGSVTSFGTTGKVRNADLIMYDRETESWWQQYEGRAIVGGLAGEELRKLPIRLESFREFRERHPSGLVLLPPATSDRAYGRNPYVGYDSAAMPFLYDGEYDGPGSAMMRVVAVEGRNEAWSLDFLREVGTVESGDLVIRWRPGQVSALDAAEIAASRDVGSVTVQRRLPGGGFEDVVYHVPFAFAFRAFNPDAPIRHNK